MLFIYLKMFSMSFFEGKQIALQNIYYNDKSSTCLFNYHTNILNKIKNIYTEEREKHKDILLNGIFLYDALDADVENFLLAEDMDKLPKLKNIYFNSDCSFGSHTYHADFFAEGTRCKNKKIKFIGNLIPLQFKKT